MHRTIFILSLLFLVIPAKVQIQPPFWRGRKIDKVFVLVLLVLFIQDMIP